MTDQQPPWGPRDEPSQPGQPHQPPPSGQQPPPWGQPWQPQPGQQPPPSGQPWQPWQPQPGQQPPPSGQPWQPGGPQYGPGAQHAPAPTPRRRTNRTILKVFGVVVAAIIVIAVAASLASSPSKPKHQPPKAVAAVAPTASPTAALSASDQAFVNDMGSWMTAHGLASSQTPAQQAQAGESVCKALLAGVPASTLIAGVTPHSTGRVIVRLAEKDICPSAAPHVIATFSGTGTENTPQFSVPDTWTLKWHYDCSSMGTSNFIVNEDGGSDLNGVTVNELGSVQSGSTIGYSDAGTHYLQVIAGGCSWSMQVVS